MLVGGPGSGKTSVISELSRRGFFCMHEVSREVTIDAKKKGIDQLFLEKPVLFSELLLEGRIQQYNEAQKSNSSFIFFDRGIPDVEAYLEFSNTPYSSVFSENSKNLRYDFIFHFKPWEEIYISDNERYESFKEASIINQHLVETYNKYNYSMIEVPFGSITERTDYIINRLQ